MEEKKGFATRLIHGGAAPCSKTGSLIPPLYQTSTFVFENMEQGARRFAGEEEGFIYTRLGNPTVQQLEEVIAELEGAEAGLAFGSGMAAISSVLLGLVRTGDHILCADGVYGCTYGLLTMLQDRFEVQSNYVDMSDEEAIRQGIQPNTRVIFLETPINPTMKIADLKKISGIAKEAGAIVVVDNTFATPYGQRPIEYGADVVIHSATKYIGGHGDVIAGLAVGRKEEMDSIRMSTLKDMGGVLSPFDAWLLLRGLKTLEVRMDRHRMNAQAVAEYLDAHPKVTRVVYPGLASYPQRELAAEQMSCFGGVISFQVEGGLEGARRVLDGVQLCQLTVSLGEVTTLIQHPATMTHSVIPEADRLRMGVTDDLIRISVGLESVEDIIADLKNALS
ncbi:methionine gamma-lyase [Marininema halotolerans]|uniref:L-methionine gamma-lyase n=1 Tax=Marininema halotolerans TaxID=1155944 RepID=A0A1I6R2P9_9BACL|nr:methionine gamma-lyase [Marininema halotolerans]SFS58946.1 methionine-gamma-lyase [Marininema halotolerans]